MIRRGENDVRGLYRGSREVVAVYRGSQKMWGRVPKFIGFRGTSKSDSVGYIHPDNGWTTVPVINGQFEVAIDTSEWTSLRYFFDEGSIETVDLTGMKTGNITDMTSMFEFCGALKSVDFSGCDTSKVTEMNSMFGNCPNLQSVNLSGWNTENVGAMASMFSRCCFTSLDLSNFNTSKVKGMGFMFSNNSKLASLDISSFDFSNVSSIYGMFNSCSSLTDLRFGKNCRVDLDLQSSPLTRESALSVIEGLAELKTGEKRSVVFSVQTYDRELNKQTDIALATSKGWSVPYVGGSGSDN